MGSQKPNSKARTKKKQDVVGVAKKPSKRTKLPGVSIPELVKKIPSTTKKQKPKVNKDSISEVKKLPRLPTKARKQAVVIHNTVRTTQIEWDKKMRISSELLEQHLKLRNNS